MTQKTSFDTMDASGETDLNQFFELYKASLSYSPDSSQFIDLYSSGLTLEKKGKKIIAIADADNAITLCNLNTKEWNRILFFGPSAGIEATAWISSTSFILAGMIYNDEGKQQPVILLCDVNSQSIRWFEANTIRPENSKYEASGLKKLKINEWE